MKLTHSRNRAIGVGPINLGNPGEFTIRELAEKIFKMTGSRFLSAGFHRLLFFLAAAPKPTIGFIRVGPM